MSEELLLAVLRQALTPGMPQRVVDCGLALGPLGWLAGARLGRSWGSAVLGSMAGLALAVALGLTALRVGVMTLGVPPGALARLRTCVVTEPHVLTPDGLVNLGLFAPAAFLAVLAIGRPLRVTAGLVMLSLVVEAVQAVRSVGVCDSSDALLNGVGALLAAVVAAQLRNAVVRTLVPGSEPCRRSC